MAEALVNEIGAGRYEAVSTRSNSARYVHPKSIETLQRHGFYEGKARSKSWDEFANLQFDVVITVCDAAAESCPTFLGKHEKLHWSIPYPARATGTESEINVTFDEAFNLSKQRIEKNYYD